MHDIIDVIAAAAAVIIIIFVVVVVAVSSIHPPLRQGTEVSAKYVLSVPYPS